MHARGHDGGGGGVIMNIVIVVVTWGDTGDKWGR